MSTTVIGCKLNNGQELIARAETEEEIELFNNGVSKSINLEFPMVFSLQRTERGFAPTIVPWVMTTSNNKVTLKQEATSTHLYDVSKEIADSYLEQTSGIKISSVLPH